MSDLTARNLRSRGATISVVANRTLEHAERLAESFDARPATIEELAGALSVADIVVSSTSAPGFVLAGESRASVLRARRGRPLLIVDLAVPRDIDPALAAIDGCFLYDIDALESVVSTTLAGRRTEAVHAERIISEEAERFRAWRASLAVVPAIASLRAHAEEIRAAELAAWKVACRRATATSSTPSRRRSSTSSCTCPRCGSRRLRSQRTGCSMLTWCAICSG